MKLSERLDQARPWGSGYERRKHARESAGLITDTVVVDGCRLRYARSEGSGPPLVLCNGIGANFELALGLVQALPGIPVILFDLPGIGGSPRALIWPSVKRYARLVHGLLQKIGVRGHFSVAGVSWGGTLAMQIAHDYPSQVLHLVLMATTPGVIMIPGKPSALLRMMTPQRYLSRTYMATHAGTLYGGAMRQHPELAVEFARLTKAPRTLGYFQQLSAISRFTALPWLHRITAPALVITGEDDPIIRPINALILARLLPCARLYMIPAGGHLFMNTHPHETADQIFNLIRPHHQGDVTCLPA